MYLARLNKTRAWLIHLDHNQNWIGVAEVDYQGRVVLRPEHYSEVEKVGFRKFREPLQIYDTDAKHFSHVAFTPECGDPTPTIRMASWMPHYYELRDEVPLYLIPVPEFELFTEPMHLLRNIQGLDFTAIRYSNTNELTDCGLTVSEFYHRANVDQLHIFQHDAEPFFNDGRFVIEENEVANYEDMSDARSLRSVADIIREYSTCFRGELHQYERIQVTRDQLIASSYMRSRTLAPTRLLEVIVKVWEIEGDHLKPSKVYDLIKRAYEDDDERYDVKSFIEYIDDEGIGYMLGYGEERKKEYDVRRTSFRENCSRARDLLKRVSVET